MRVLNTVADPILFAKNRIEQSPGLLFTIVMEGKLWGGAWNTKGELPVYLHVSAEKEGFVDMSGICLNGKLSYDAPSQFNLNRVEGREAWLKLMDKLDTQAPKPELH